MEPLERLLHVASRLELEAFQSAHAGLYLLGMLPSEDPAAALQPWTYTTQPGWKLQEGIRRALHGDPALLLRGRFLHRLEKTGRNPWQGRLSVGRAANNDVVVRHPSVSKLHAHLVLTAGDFDRPARLAFALVDCGSRNGTLLNGRPVDPGPEVPLQAGDRIGLGAVGCELLDARGLHPKLRALAALLQSLRPR